MRTTHPYRRVTQWLLVPALLSAALIISVPASAAPVGGAQITFDKQVFSAVGFAVSARAGDVAAAVAADVAAGRSRPLRTPPRPDLRPPSRKASPASDQASGQAMVAGSSVPVPPATFPADAPAPPTTVNFDGISNADNPRLVVPPDPVGDVGPNHYVQMVNTSFAVYTKTGTRVMPPTPLSALFAALPPLPGRSYNPCELDSGDPIVLHDQIANRWLLTQLSTPTDPDTGQLAPPPYFLCLAVSVTPDPTGEYYLYAYDTQGFFPDYPKYGVWPDAYYASTVEFNLATGQYVGVGAYAIEKSRLLVGDGSAKVVKAFVPAASFPFLAGDGLLPGDLDGATLPPIGAPNPFIGTMDDGAGLGAPFDGVNLFHFKVNSWRPTTDATFTLAALLPTAPVDTIYPCGGAQGRSCIPQPTTARRLDFLNRQRPLHRAAYQRFPGYESLVGNQSVEASPGVAGVRWFEIRQPLTATAFVAQQGIQTASDGVNRWLGSIAQDRAGNMAVGYSVSSATVFPGIRYAGRLATDPLGTLPQTEQVLIGGAGAQTGTERWGDYSSMNVDPIDHCTFWYTNEYYAATSPAGWRTRIGSFRFPACG